MTSEIRETNDLLNGIDAASRTLDQAMADQDWDLVAQAREELFRALRRAATRAHAKDAESAVE